MTSFPEWLDLLETCYTPESAAGLYAETLRQHGDGDVARELREAITRKWGWRVRDRIKERAGELLFDEEIRREKGGRS